MHAVPPPFDPFNPASTYNDPRGLSENPALAALAAEVLTVSKTLSFERRSNLSIVEGLARRLDPTLPLLPDAKRVTGDRALEYLNSLHARVFLPKNQALAVNLIQNRAEVFHGTLLPKDRLEIPYRSTSIHLHEVRLHHTPSEFPALNIGTTVFIDREFAEKDAAIMYAMALDPKFFSKSALWASLERTIVAAKIDLPTYCTYFGFERLKQACLGTARQHAFGVLCGASSNVMQRSLDEVELLRTKDASFGKLALKRDAPLDKRLVIAMGVLEFGSRVEGVIEELLNFQRAGRFDRAAVAIADFFAQHFMAKELGERNPAMAFSRQGIMARCLFSCAAECGIDSAETLVNKIAIKDTESCHAVIELMRKILRLELTPEDERTARCIR